MLCLQRKTTKCYAHEYNGIHSLCLFAVIYVLKHSSTARNNITNTKSSFKMNYEMNQENILESITLSVYILIYSFQTNLLLLLRL